MNQNQKQELEREFQIFDILVQLELLPIELHLTIDYSVISKTQKFGKVKEWIGTCDMDM